MGILNDLHYPRLATNNFYFFIWKILYRLLIPYSFSDQGHFSVWNTRLNASTQTGPRLLVCFGNCLKRSIFGNCQCKKEEPALNLFPQTVVRMHPNAKLKVVYCQEDSACVMPLSQDKESNKLFEITPDIMLGELHRVSPNLILCTFLKFLILLEGFILLSSGLLPTWS